MIAINCSDSTQHLNHFRTTVTVVSDAEKAGWRQDWVSAAIRSALGAFGSAYELGRDSRREGTEYRFVLISDRPVPEADVVRAVSEAEAATRFAPAIDSTPSTVEVPRLVDRIAVPSGRGVLERLLDQQRSHRDALLAVGPDSPVWNHEWKTSLKRAGVKIRELTRRLQEEN